MPRTVRFRPSHGAKYPAIFRMLHPYALIRENWPNTWHRERVDGMVLVGQDFRVVMRGGPATDAFIIRNEYLPNKELYATKRMVHIPEEGPQ